MRAIIIIIRPVELHTIANKIVLLLNILREILCVFTRLIFRKGAFKVLACICMSP